MPTISSWSEMGVYTSDPWENITTNERKWYDPLLRGNYARSAVYSPFVQMQVDLNGPSARTIEFTELISPRPNISPMSNRAVDASRLYSDTFARRVTTQRYGNGMSFHKESQMFTYWERNGQQAAIKAIIDQSLGQTIIDHIDLLARNEYMRHPAPLFGTQGSATAFGGVTDSDKMSTSFVDNLWLLLGDRERPFSPVSTSEFDGSETLCITTRGVIFDLKTEVGTGAGGLNFVDVNKYSEAGRQMLISGELGTYRGVRFVESPMARLWNVGTIAHQTTIKAAIKPGDGAPDPATTAVDNVKFVGQPGATHYILVNDASGFSVHDKVTIHRVRHDGTSLAAYGYKGVLNGVVFDDPMIQNVEIASIDTTGGTGAHKLVLKEPYMMVDSTGFKGLETDLGSTVYGYVTKAKTIHSALFLTPGMSRDGVVAGIAQLPKIYTPRPIDDYESIYRVAYDFWMKFQLWDPRKFSVAWLTGPNAVYGKTTPFR